MGTFLTSHDQPVYRFVHAMRVAHHSLLRNPVGAALFAVDLSSAIVLLLLFTTSPSSLGNPLLPTTALSLSPSPFSLPRCINPTRVLNFVQPSLSGLARSTVSRYVAIRLITPQLTA
jgi:hypothetical protein